MTMEWDPHQYDKFRAAREQPFDDVVALIEKVPRPRIVDLGCGPGSLTRKLLDHFPDGEVVGLDSSEAMLKKAYELSAPGLSFTQLDIEAFAGGAVGGSFDVIFSNAALHWVLDHATLLPKIAARLSARGQLAVQLPSDGYNSTRKIFADVAGWRHEMGTLDIADYAQLLYEAGLAGQVVFEKIYPHILPDADAVLEWAKGTALLPYLQALPPAQHGPYIEEVRKRLHARYPEKPVFFPFRRIIFYARRA
jgi:trans-aconitate 2-methyltransferase